MESVVNRLSLYVFVSETREMGFLTRVHSMEDLLRQTTQGNVGIKLSVKETCEFKKVFRKEVT